MRGITSIMYAHAAETVRRPGSFEVPFKRSSERNEFRSRADERLSAVEPQRLSRRERSARPES